MFEKYQVSALSKQQTPTWLKEPGWRPVTLSQLWSFLLHVIVRIYSSRDASELIPGL